MTQYDVGKFLVQRHMCSSCIYRKDSSLDVKTLEAEIADPHLAGFFLSYRACHHAHDTSGICCAGFWKRHKNAFTLGQLAQRLKRVRLVVVDIFAKKGNDHG